MSDICVVYYDLVEIPAEILSVVNIKHYGSLHYKKQKLAQYHENIFKTNGIGLFCHIKSTDDLQDFINYYSLSNINSFIFFPSSFAIVNPPLFSEFIKRIRYIDSELGIFNFDSIRSFVKLEKKSMMHLMEMLLLNKHNVESILTQNFSNIEKFRKENFYLQINSYVEFIKFLHSNFELRYFNSLQTNGLVITKSSSKKAKMLSEFKYFDFVPEQLKLYFLRPFDFKENENDAQYSLEQLNIPDLAIQWIHFSIDIPQFKILMDRIFTFLINRASKKSSTELVQKSISNLYIDKLSERLENLKQTNIYSQVDNIISNCSSYNGLTDVFQHYNALFHKLSHLRKNESEQHFGHGDLCFSNILYDKRIDYIKFIDPKGAIAVDEVYFDRYYDLAKLSHSVLGNYDFINNSIFSLNFDNSLHVSLHIDATEDNNEYKVIFKSFLEKNNFDYRLVRLYEASLFLSMLPLHIDFPKKVLAFVLNAIQIIEELEKSSN